MVALTGSELVGMREGHHKFLTWVEAPPIDHQEMVTGLGWEEKDEIHHHHSLLTILLSPCPTEKSSQFPSLLGARAALLGKAGMALCLGGNLPCTKPIPRSATSC